MKNILTNLFLFLSIWLYSQQSTFTKTFDWAEDMIPMNMLIYEGHLFVPILVYNNGEVGRSIIYQIDYNGIVTDSIELSEGEYNWIYEILPGENGNLYAFGSSWEGQLGPVYDKVYELSNTQLLNTNTYPTSYGGFNRMHGFVNNQGNFVIIGDLSSVPDSPQIYNYDVRIVEYDENINVALDTIYSRPDGQIVWAADYSDYLNSYHLYTNYDFDPNYLHQPQYNILDSTYAIVFSSDIVEPVHFRSYSSIKIINENSLFQAGDVLVFEQPNDYYNAYAIYKFSIDYQVIDSVIIDFNNDTSNRIAYYNGFDFFNPNELYFLGTKNYSLYDNSFLELIRLDEDLNVQWRKYYGGDKNYLTNEIKALEEGGCIISSVFKDENGYRKTIIMKFDENGLITSTDESPIPIKNAIVTPNPGKEYLQLHSGAYPAVFQLFNMGGQLILEQKINQSTTSIATQSLSAGTYIWQLLKDGKVVETDKWVKE